MVREYEEKQKVKKFMYSPIPIIAMLAVFAMLTVSVFKAHNKSKITEEKRVVYEKELAALVAQKEDIEEEIGQLTTKHGIEQEIRERFRVVKEGEEVIVIVDYPVESEVDDSKKRGRLKQFFNKVFRKKA